MIRERGPLETPIQLTPLRSFVMVAQLGSFAEVARALGYTEPAVHLQIAGLKKIAGGELFYRADRRMRLTPLGERLLPYAQEAVGAVQRLSNEIAGWRATEDHVLRVGLGRSSGTYLFPFVAATLGRSHPEMLLQPSIMPLNEIIEALVHGEIDLAIITGLRTRLSGDPPEVPLTAAPLAPYHWTLAARPETVTSRDCCTNPVDVFVPDYASGMAAAIEERVRHVLPAFQVAVAPNAEAAKAHALAGRGFAYIPEYVCRLELSNHQLVHCLPFGGRQRTTVDIGHARPPAHRDVLSVVKSLRGLKRHLLDDPGAIAHPDGKLSAL